MAHLGEASPPAAPRRPLQPRATARRQPTTPSARWPAAFRPDKSGPDAPKGIRCRRIAGDAGGRRAWRGHCRVGGGPRNQFPFYLRRLAGVLPRRSSGPGTPAPLEGSIRHPGPCAGETSLSKGPPPGATTAGTGAWPMAAGASVRGPPVPSSPGGPRVLRRPRRHRDHPP